MKKLSIALSVLAIVFATLAAYSFTVKPAAAKKAAITSPNVNYWIKYDCRTVSAVTLVATGANFTAGNPSTLPGYAANCPGSLSICARLYTEANTIPHPTQPNNRIPKDGVDETPFLDEIQCVNIVP